jgi:N-dimethylarginine dimethylaminohydrolase
MIAFNEYDRLTRVALRHARNAFGGPEQIDREWRPLNFTAPPDYQRAAAQYDQFAALLTAAGAAINEAPDAVDLTLDAVYVRDASIVTPAGIVLARMGKPARRGESAADRLWFECSGLRVLGCIEAPGMLEGGDIVWFDERTVAVGRGYRTNDEGIRQLRRWLDPEVHVEVVPLPHFRGPADVFHLMSILSPIDRDLAVVYSPLMPIPFREWLLDRGMTLVDVPEAEFDSMGANVLALAPRRALMIEGNPITRARLESARADVLTYDGSEISLKGGGGPTCLTRPLSRSTPS